MINVSNEFKKQLASDNRNYLEYADITLKDGTVLHLTNENLWNGGLSVEDAVSSDNSFDIGAAIINKGTLTINNIYDDFSDYVFEDAEVIASVGLELPDGTIEKIRKGTYAVDEPSYNGSIITLSCLDNMRKFDRAYSESKLTYPATLNAIVRDACSVCGVTLQTVSFPHDDFVVQTRPTDEATTFREVISWVAQIAGCFCRCDAYGRLELKWYDQTALENPKVIDWDAENPVGTENAHWLKTNYSAPVVSLDDVVITGVRVAEKNESEETQEQLTTYQAGSDGYVISVENNELIKSGAGQTVAGWLGEQLIGVRFRKATVNHASDPTIEAGDIAVVTDRKGNNYNIVVSSTKFSTGSSQNTVSAAENPARNSATRYSAQTKNYVEWRNAIEKEKTEREKALEELEERLANSPGVFTTVETQSNGSKIYYLHNKPNLSESDMIWKMTAEAWGVSTDGGKTWNAGMTVDGDTIVRILTATGVSADWINAGAIMVKDNAGNVIFSVDMDTKQVIISGDSVHIGGKTATTAINDVLAESKDYADGKLADYANSVTANITNLQSQIDGAIETFFYDYEPTLQNIPASQWTTTEERRKHEGDLFYWKSKGYAYRFFQDGATWKWQLVQDTDITQAMAAAEKAQDTADGKRRVFVVTPQPPYDIGDLWANGTDILTCAVARAQGSTYVSSDWQKLNNYTDDTVANEALEEAKKTRNLNIILDNEYQGIPADYQGNIATFPTVQTFVQVLYGHTDVSVNCSYSIQKSFGVTGTWDNTTRTYTVTALTTDNGWVDITASYLNLFTTTKRFNVAKVKGGKPGADGLNGLQGEKGDPGEAGRTYFMEPSTLVVKRSQDNSMAPNYITLSAYYRDGTTTARTAYAGRFKIEESLDGANWTTIYTSSANESTVTHSLLSALATSAGGAISTASNKIIGIPRDVVALRCTLYAAGGTTQMLDMQSIAVVVDVDALTAEQVLEILSDGWQGIYSAGDKYYISAEFIKAGEMLADRIRGGTLTLGGISNGNGKLIILNSSGNRIGYIDNAGVNFERGYFSGQISAANIYGGDINGAKISSSDTLVNVDGFSYNVISELEKGKLNFYIDDSDGIYELFAKITPYVGGGLFENDTYRARKTIYIYAKNGVNIGLDNSNCDLNVYGNIWCKTFMSTTPKSRIADTAIFGQRKLYCYETPEAMFGDIGTAKTDESGMCYVSIDAIFEETINTDIEYQVFLQKEGPGDLWVSEKASSYFSVSGTPNLAFSWELKAVQKEYETLFLDDIALADIEISDTSDLESIFDNELKSYDAEMEEIFNESIESISGN